MQTRRCRSTPPPPSRRPRQRLHHHLPSKHKPAPRSSQSATQKANGASQPTNNSPRCAPPRRQVSQVLSPQGVMCIGTSPVRHVCRGSRAALAPSQYGAALPAASCMCRPQPAAQDRKSATSNVWCSAAGCAGASAGAAAAAAAGAWGATPAGGAAAGWVAGGAAGAAAGATAAAGADTCGSVGATCSSQAPGEPGQRAQHAHWSS